MAIRRYYVSDGKFPLSKHFNSNEMLNDSDYWTVPKPDSFLLNDDLFSKVEDLMLELGAVEGGLSSGFRTDASSVSVGGRAGDMHTLGNAIDLAYLLDVNGNLISGDRIVCKAQDLGFNGIGWHCGGNPFSNAVHLDIGDRIWHGDEARNNATVSDFYVVTGIQKEEPQPIPEPESEPSDVTIDEGGIEGMTEDRAKYEIDRIAWTHLHRKLSVEDNTFYYEELVNHRMNWKMYTDGMMESEEAMRIYIKHLFDDVKHESYIIDDINWWYGQYANTDLSKETMNRLFANPLEYNEYVANHM